MNSNVADVFFLRRETNEIAHPSYKFSGSKWLCEIVIPAKFEPLHALIDGASRREDKDRCFDPESAQSEYQIDPIKIGKAKIDDQSIKRLLGYLLKRSIGIVRRLHLPPGIEQRLFDEALNLEFVLYQQESHTGIVSQSPLHRTKNPVANALYKQRIDGFLAI